MSLVSVSKRRIRGDTPDRRSSSTLAVFILWPRPAGSSIGGQTLRGTRDKTANDSRAAILAKFVHGFHARVGTIVAKYGPSDYAPTDEI